MQEEKVIAEIEAYLEQLVADDQFSGTVLVAKDATILFKHAYGWASSEARENVLVEQRQATADGKQDC